MPTGADDARWSAAQQQLLTALQTNGATKPEYAQPIDRLPPVQAGELKALVENGIVREASANGYYLFRRQEMVQMEPARSPSFSMRVTRLESPQVSQRLIRTIVFWLLVMLIPIILIQLTGSRR
jgi:hypothetical protein